MQKVILISIVLICAINTNLSAQNKFKAKEIDPVTQSLAKSCNIRLETSTYLVGLFPSFTSLGGEIAMVKGEGNYYTVVKYSNLPLNRLDEKHSLYFNFSNGEKLQLLPYGSVTNKTEEGAGTIYYFAPTLDRDQPYGISSFSIAYSNNVYHCLYTISPEQLQKLAANRVNSISLQFKSNEVIKDSQVDPDGNTILEYKTSIFKRYIKGISRCILSS